MKIKTIDRDGNVTNQRYYPADGTSFQGEIDVSYDVLVNTFGKPTGNDGYKIDAEWNIITPDGFATIYNYKTGKNYLGKEGLSIKEIRDWHIGGKTKDVIPWILLALEISIGRKI